MNIKRRAVLITMVISAFLTLSAATGASASDNAGKGVSPSDASVKVLTPEKADGGEKETIKHSDQLSYGMQIIKSAKKLKKTAVRASIRFDRSDFSGFSEGKAVNSLTIRSLPDSGEGVLKLGALDVFSGQRIAATLIDKLEFVPSHAGAEAEFTFSVNDSDAESECVLSCLKTENKAPEAESLSVYTKQNVTVYSQVSVSDPDGDMTSCKVVSQPSHGLLKISGDGSFSYKPEKNHAGNDSFVCSFEDEYGNVSEPVTVKVRTERNTSGISYSDLDGSRAEYAAYLLAEREILTGQRIGDTAYFEPEKTVKRADFIVMAMKAAGYSPNVYSPLREGFTDASELTEKQRGYVVTAMSAKVIEAEEKEDGLVIRPNDDITLKEASAIVSALTGKTASPGDSQNKDVKLSRADAAVMLAALIDGRR